MKKITLSITLLFCVCIINAQELDLTKLHGKWVVDKIELYKSGELDNTEQKEIKKDCPNYMEFGANGTAVNYKFEEDCSLFKKDEGTFTFEDSVLKVTENSGRVGFEMKLLELLDDTMVLSRKQEFDGAVYERRIYMKRHSK